MIVIIIIIKVGKTEIKMKNHKMKKEIKIVRVNSIMMMKEDLNGMHSLVVKVMIKMMRKSLMMMRKSSFNNLILMMKESGMEKVI